LLGIIPVPEVAHARRREIGISIGPGASGTRQKLSPALNSGENQEMQGMLYQVRTGINQSHINSS
jgi:hypothetical protein